MSDLIVFIYCLPAFLITCVMLFLAFLIKHQDAEKRVFERGAIDGKASKPSAQRKKFLDKRLRSVLLPQFRPNKVDFNRLSICFHFPLLLV